MTAAPLDYRPAPSAASRARIIGSVARLELRLLLRNGEQLLLTLGIPLILLVGLSTIHVISLGKGPAIQWAAPGVLTLAVMSTAFTAQAIATGFDRRSGAIAYFGSTPIGRSGLLFGKALAITGIELVQFAILVPTALALGWHPHGDWLSAIIYIVLGTAAFTSLGLALAGVLRAEAVLAVANALWLFMLLIGGTIIPLDRFPHWLAAFGAALPSGALGAGLRSVLVYGDSLAGWPILVLLIWTAIGSLVVTKTFRWD